MVLVLCIGDAHIPHRAPGLPPKFGALLVPGRVATALVTGNLCSQDVLNHLRSICADVRAVRGDFDDAAVKGGDVEVVSIGDFRVGLCHGHAVVPWGDASALDLLQRRLGVDILVTGHSHALSVTAAGGRLRIDPGSATGAWAPHAAAPSVPSFVLMDVTGSRAVVYMYRLPGGAGSDELKVEKLEFFKGGAGAPPA